METAVVSTEFEIFAPRPVQSSVLGTIEVPHKPLAGVEQSDLKFLVPAENDTYIDTNIKMFVRGKLTKPNGADLNASDFTAVTISCRRSSVSAQ